jgi:hypothetical protein
MQGVWTNGLPASRHNAALPPECVPPLCWSAGSGPSADETAAVTVKSNGDWFPAASFPSTTSRIMARTASSPAAFLDATPVERHADRRPHRRDRFAETFRTQRPGNANGATRTVARHRGSHTHAHRSPAPLAPG